MINGSGPKKSAGALAVAQAPTSRTAGDLDTAEDWADLRRERRATDDALADLDSLLPEPAPDSEEPADADPEWDTEETQAGQGTRPRRRTTTLGGAEPAPEFPVHESTSGTRRGVSLSDLTEPVFQTASGFRDERMRLGFWALTLLFVAFLVVMIGEGKIKLPTVTW